MLALRHPIALALLALYALALLTVGLTRDWRLLHEDNGALHTTLALSHLMLGLGATRGHNVLYAPATGEMRPYANHPAATALLVAGAFALAGADDPWVARLVPIAFHLGTVLLGVELLAAVLPLGAALAGGAILATVPMSAYFGRMVNFEPLCLFGVMLALTGYAAWLRRRALGSLGRCAAGLIIAGLVDWPAFFFAAALILAEARDGWRARPRRLGPAAALAAAAAAALAIDLGHLWYAGSAGALAGGAGVWRGELVKLSPVRFVGHLLETARRYFTHAGLVSAALAVLAAARPAARLGRWLMDGAPRDLVRRLLVVTGLPALGYVLAAPPWAITHPYWQFYALPFVTLATALVGHRLWRWARATRAVPALVCLALFAGDLAIGSALLLYVRHTRPGGYGLRQTTVLRDTYLAPRHARQAPTR